MFKRGFVLIAAASLLINAVLPCAAAETQQQVQDAASATGRPTSYQEYLSVNANAARTKNTVNAVLQGAAETDAAQIDLQKHTATFLTEGSGAVWQAEIPEPGFYGIQLSYTPIKADMEGIELSFWIDGKLPFREAGEFAMKTPWTLDKIVQDERGNDMMPKQQVALQKTTQWLYEQGSSYQTPALFYLEAGVHELELRSDKAPFVLHEIRLEYPVPAKAYPDYQKTFTGKEDSAADAFRVLNGESPSLRSDASIQPKYDIQNASTQPSDPEKMKLNALSGTNWSQAGQWVEWQFDIEKSGWYYIDIKAMQSEKNGMYVYRRILLDGEVPFDQLNEVEFPYSGNWQMKTLGDEEPYRFYLEKGTHRLRMEAVLGKYSNFISEMYQEILTLNEIYREIIMVTGTAPDRFRDYDLKALVPNLEEKLDDSIARIQALHQKVTETFASGMDASILNNLLTQLKQFRKNTGRIPESITSFNSNITSLSAWTMNLETQPLSIDYIKLRGNSVPVDKPTVGFFSQLTYFVRNIIATFYSDYAEIGVLEKEEEALNIWVGAGRDQAQLLKRMAENSYRGGRVNINMVKTGLLEAVMAGRGPDVSLFVGVSDPINYASRGALLDLRQFQDFSQIADRFNLQSMVPFTYQGGIFALPLTQSFPMMFYRTDIFEELGIAYPETWDDLFTIIPIIQGQNMNVGLTEDIFPTLLYQNGGSYYSDDLSHSALNSEEAVTAFTKWTEFYTVYSLPVSFSFLNRFRSGEMPLGMASYVLYTQLKSAAPEITGLWEMKPLPATKLADGSLSNAIAGNASEAAIILASSKKQEKAWEFLKWLTQADTQAEFGNQIEAALGPIARYDTANIEALQLLPWGKQEKELLTEQLNRLNMVPKIPATYFVSRQLNNAFRKVIYNNENARHTIYQYNSMIDQEIQRKNNQLKKYVLS